ncbi:hypothetical protein EEJ42_02410 [Streptomyces botrytidirepellens]|uniref:Uncharacterized protein n=1 Tax=Streptomyces botrytidirepellens TaxID=2486417 RepID=A0A3M8X6Q7_9ACTN|nr:hypothetical protein EEJ42_02410 [Streptomyces botrytidirepellens]
MNLFVGIIRGGREECKSEVGEFDSLVIFRSLNAVFPQVSEDMPVGAAKERDSFMCHLCFRGDLDEFQGILLVEGQE